MPDPELTQTQQAQAQQAVLKWAETELRDLPWRKSRDPWVILVAEVMSHQTQLQRVIPKWEEFLSHWPTPKQCASAPLSDILTVWSGLGYPRRARSLWETAQQIVRDCNGVVPMEYDYLIQLSGIGPYTANAILCFSGERDVGLVDTNIGRILARVHGVRLRPREAQRYAEAFVPPQHGWQWNQALLDIGALFCRPVPNCRSCPLEETCLWHRRGHAEPDPAQKSAGVSTPQSTFEGSFRQDRGQVLRVLAEASHSFEELETILDVPKERLLAVVESLRSDQLIEFTNERFRLGWRGDISSAAQQRY